MKQVLLGFFLSLVGITGSAIAQMQPFAIEADGAIARDPNERAQDWATVKDFGARGDCVTDDTAAFKKALASGRVVWVPWPGKNRCYLVTNLAASTPGSVLKGASLGGIIPAQDGSVKIKQKAGTKGTLVALDTYRTGIESLTLECATGSGGYGFQTRGQSAVVRDLSTFYCNNRVGKSSSGSYATSGGCRFSNITVAYPPGDGFVVHDVNPNTPSNGCSFYDIRVLFNNAGVGVLIQNSQHNDFYNLLVEGGTGFYALKLTGTANNNRFFGGDLDENTGTIYSAWIDTGASDNAFFGTALVQGLFDNGNRTRLDVPYNGARYPGMNKVPYTTTIGTISIQSDALLGAMRLGNGIEFGSPLTTGYRHHLGSNANTHRGFLAFHAEAGTRADTFRTRGIKGTVLMSDLAGGGGVYTVATASADNQAPIPKLSWNESSVTVNAGRLIFVNGTEPKCDATNRGVIVMVQGGAGAADTLRICAKDGADAYSYRALF